MRRLAFVLIWCVWWKVSYGQSPFVQASQATLLFHPSNAGAHHTPRVVSATNYLAQENTKALNTYLSYDHFSEKLNLGLGGYYAFSNQQETPLAPLVRENVPKNQLNNHYIEGNQHSIGLAVSPKLNMQRKSNFNEVAFTFSPSLFVSYRQNNIDYNKLKNTTVYKETVFSPTSPDGKEQDTDSVSVAYWSNTIKERAIEAGLGFQITGARTIFQVSIPFELIGVKEFHSYQHYTSPGGMKKNIEKERKRTFWALNPQLSGGYSFLLSSSNNLHLTVIGALAYRLYNVDFAKEAAYQQGFYGEYIREQHKTGWHYANGSLLLRKDKALLGGGYTFMEGISIYALTGGYQADDLKITGSLMFGSSTFFELTMAFMGW